MKRSFTMNYLVLYSSRTGNTRMVARAIQKALPEGTPCVDIKVVTGEHAVHRFNKLGIYFALTDECA